MFLISASKNSTLNVVKSLFRLKSISFFEVELLGNKYILSNFEPYKILPMDLMRKIKVQKISPADAKKLVQSERKEKTEKVKGKIEPGARVLVAEGPYKGMKGVVSKLCPGDNIEVLVPVFGSYVPVRVSKQSVVLDTV